MTAHRGAAALALVVVACGGDGATPDASTGGDAPQIDEWSNCDPAFDHAYIATRFDTLPVGQGGDVDGDGTIDNALGLLAPQLNAGTTEGIANGNVAFLFVVDGLTLPPPGAPVEARLYMPPGGDADDDPTNTLTGAGEVLVNRSAFDVDCAPRSAMLVEQDGLDLTGDVDVINFLNASAGDVHLIRVHFDAQVSADGSSLSIEASGAWTACALDRIAFVGVSAVPVLRTLGAFLQPDIDGDGDGLETIEVDSSIPAVVRCIDGDGTVYEDPTCPCFPEIADAYSAAADIDAVPVVVVGVY